MKNEVLQDGINKKMVGDLSTRSVVGLDAMKLLIGGFVKGYTKDGLEVKISIENEANISALVTMIDTMELFSEGFVKGYTKDGLEILISNRNDSEVDDLICVESLDAPKKGVCVMTFERTNNISSEDVFILLHNNEERLITFEDLSNAILAKIK